jgi:hypothetical protein
VKPKTAALFISAFEGLKMKYWEHIYTETINGFEIQTHITSEDANPRYFFDDSLLDDVFEGIESGRYEWFTVRVTAHKAGIELGSDYLGGCLYESYTQFIEQNDYYADMCERAIDEAKATIKQLCEVTA